VAVRAFSGRGRYTLRLKNGTEVVVDLSDILPRARLLERFGDGVIFEEYGKSELRAIAKTNPEGLHHVAANVWNRIIQKGLHTVSPLHFAGYFRTGNPDLHIAISALACPTLILPG